MAGISSPGVGSGLDIKSLVASLVNAETTPTKNRLDRQEASFLSELSALGQVNSTIAKLQTTLNRLGTLNQLYGLKTTVSDNSALQASTTKDALLGSYDIDIQQLASKQSLSSSAFASNSSTVGTGSIQIDFGTYSNDLSSFTVNPDKASVNIAISAQQNTLQGIRDAINNSNSGVQASIVKDDLGSRLTLTSPETGKKYAMRITVTDNDGNNTNSSGLSALAYNPTAGVNSLSQTVAPKDSQIQINGVLLTQSSNTLTDAITGVTLDLKKAQPGTLIKLNIEQNKEQLSGLIKDFVKQYNDTLSNLNSLTSYDPTSKKAGPLQGDAGIRALKFNLSTLIAERASDPNNSLQTLAAIGIKNNQSGALELNEETLTKAIESNYNDIGALFAKSATTTDSNVQLNSVGSSVKAGTYNIIVNSFTPNVSLSGTIDGTIASSTDGFILNGSGVLKDLSLKITDGSTGARGSVTVYDGISDRLNSLIDSYLSKTGTLEDRTKGLNKRMDSIKTSREQLDLRASQLEKRYLNQFTALDQLLAKMQSTSDFLSQQINTLSQLTKNSR